MTTERRFALAAAGFALGALSALAPAAAFAQQGGSGIPDVERIPQSVEEVRDPDGPIGPEELASGNFVVPGVPVHDNEFRVFAITDRLEYQTNEGDPKYVWDVFGFAGGDYNKLWVESEGEGLFDGRAEAADLQLLYSRAITAYWDVQAGVRYAFRPDPSEWYGVLAFEGLNVYWTGQEIDFYVSEEGDLSGAFEVEYDGLLTQRLILQPRFELNWQAQDRDELGLAAGITGYEAGLRLRYEFYRELAPYVGFSFQQTVGGTADRLPDEADPSKISLVAGLRVWF